LLFVESSYCRKFDRAGSVEPALAASHQVTEVSLSFRYWEPVSPR
jgi:hypothetical protein